MTLPFTTTWPDRMGDLAGQPNYFIEKIYAYHLRVSYKYNKNVDEFTEWEYWHNSKNYFQSLHKRKFNRPWDTPITSIPRGDAREYLTAPVKYPKIHTIREDPHNRWRPGMKIHPVINNRSKDRFQFAPVLECTGAQKIEITHFDGYILIMIGGEFFGEVYHHGIGEIYEYTNDIVTLAVNDGFPSVEAFFMWFNKDFQGKIIHWTDIRY